MSEAHPHTSSTHGRQEHAVGDGMNLKKIVAVGVGALAIFAIGIWWAYSLMSHWRTELQAGGAARTPTELGKTEIGIVDQVPFEKDHRLDVWRAERAKRLGTFGWVDRAKGIAHIPIEQAMERVVASPPDIPGEGVRPVAAAPLAPIAPSPPATARTPGRARAR
jgi:hypothetical protein